ncbi:MAG: 4-hydroxy-tetrahydrodipicolinate synthase [Thaumarchaeota archaeon]|nr:4-hydroxy-tetrahydrodipicolinate synthase [Nitrososphaerota archaeon]
MLQGCYTALITPFTHDSLIDYEGLSQLIDFQISENVSGILIAGTTGESPTLSWAEHEKLIKTVYDLAGERTVVIAGTGSNNTGESLKATKFAHDLGIKHVLLIDPYYNGPSSIEIRREYIEVIAQAFPSLTIIPYIIPGRTGTKLLPQDLAFSYKNYPNINTVKEATGDFENAKLTRKLCGNNFSIISGDDDKTVSLIQDSDIKANGVISVASNLVPAAIAELVSLTLANNDDLIELQNNVSPLFKLVGVTTTEFTELGNVIIKSRNPVPTKTLMRLFGMPSGPSRKPLGLVTYQAMQFIIKQAKLVYENSNLFKPIEDFFDINIQERLYSDKYIQKLYYESY